MNVSDASHRNLILTAVQQLCHQQPQVIFESGYIFQLVQGSCGSLKFLESPWFFPDFHGLESPKWQTTSCLGVFESGSEGHRKCL